MNRACRSIRAHDEIGDAIRFLLVRVAGRADAQARLHGGGLQRSQQHLIAHAALKTVRARDDR